MFPFDFQASDFALYRRTSRRAGKCQCHRFGEKLGQSHTLGIVSFFFKSLKRSSLRLDGIALNTLSNRSSQRLNIISAVGFSHDKRRYSSSRIFFLILILSFLSTLVVWLNAISNQLLISRRSGSFIFMGIICFWSAVHFKLLTDNKW